LHESTTDSRLLGVKTRSGAELGHSLCEGTLSSTPNITFYTTFMNQHRQKKKKPDVGLEPTTLRLRVSRATDCASRADVMEHLLVLMVTFDI
jgi:hypothetical protein